MKALYLLTVFAVAIGLGIVLQAVQAPAPAAGGRGPGGGQGGQRGPAAPANAAAVTSATPNAGNGTLIGGSSLPDKTRCTGLGVAGQGIDESGDAATALQQGQGASAPG
jgi:hypothetical protein